MAACNFCLYTWRQIKFQRNCNYKKPNYLTFGRAVSGLNVNEPKLSPVLTLRVELKERKCEIRLFKVCSSKLTITSLTRSDLSSISKRTLYCSSPKTFGFQNGAVGDWADALEHARKPKPSSDRELWFGNVHRLSEIFQQLSLMLKTKKLLWSNKRCDACKKKSARCKRKATFHYKGKLQVFRAGLKEIKYDYVDSKQHFYLQYHVAAIDMKALCKKQTTLQAVAYLEFPAPGDKLSLDALTQLVRGSIK